MSSEQEMRRYELLEEVLALPVEERSGFLTVACGSDADLRTELERLLAVNERMSEAFLSEPAESWITAQRSDRKRIGRYLIQHLIGEGGMSRVYEAIDPEIGRTVAVKVLLSNDDAGNRRFFSELRSLGRIRHDHVVQVYDYGESDGVWYIVMERLEGEDLASAIKADRCGDLSAKLAVARQIAVALRHIHSAGILHRDIKPANVFLEPSGRVKIMDFGIARPDNSSEVTRTQVLIGTPEYLAPEQVRGQPATQATDIYSFGVLMFELFTGTKPYQGNTAEVLYKVVNESIPLEPLRAAGLSSRLTQLIRNASAKSASSRPPGLDAIIAELDSIAAAAGRERAGSLRRLVAPVAVAVTLAVGAALWQVRPLNLRAVASPTMTPAKSSGTLTRPPHGAEKPAPDVSSQAVGPKVAPSTQESPPREKPVAADTPAQFHPGPHATAHGSDPILPPPPVLESITAANPSVDRMIREWPEKSGIALSQQGALVPSPASGPAVAPQAKSGGSGQSALGASRPERAQIQPGSPAVLPADDASAAEDQEWTNLGAERRLKSLQAKWDPDEAGAIVAALRRFHRARPSTRRMAELQAIGNAVVRMVAETDIRNHCCPKRDRLLLAAVEREGVLSRECRSLGGGLPIFA